MLFDTFDILRRRKEKIFGKFQKFGGQCGLFAQRRENGSLHHLYIRFAFRKTAPLTVKLQRFPSPADHRQHTTGIALGNDIEIHPSAIAALIVTIHL